MARFSRYGLALSAGVVSLVLGGAVTAGPLALEQVQKLTADDGGEGQHFGTGISMDGDTAVIGAPQDSELGAASGAAYVFVRSGGVWVQQAKLLPDDGAARDFFGARLSISGDSVVVGVPSRDDNGSTSGAAYVFVRSGEVWSQQAKLLPDDGSKSDRFGESVSLDGDTAVIGAVLDEDNGPNSGSAYVFVRSGEVWTQQAKLTPDDGAEGTLFGNAISLDGDTAVIAAVLDAENGSQSGAVYVFVRTGEQWTQQAKLLADDGSGSDMFGFSVALDGDTAVIGAVQRFTEDPGAAYVFARSDGGWAQQAKLLPDDGETFDQFGYSVALDGDTAVIGAVQTLREGPGADYVFARSDGGWTQQAKLLADDGEANDHFGAPVRLDGNNALIGALGDDDLGESSGAVYVFRSPTPDPVEGIVELKDRVGGIGLHHGIENSLSAKLDAALAVLTDVVEGNDHAAANILGAFIHQIEAQRGRKIASEDADELIAASREIIDVLAP